MKFQTALETAPEHTVTLARTREGWLAIQVAGQWFSVHGSAVVPYEGAVESTDASEEPLPES